MRYQCHLRPVVCVPSMKSEIAAFCCCDPHSAFVRSPKLLIRKIESERAAVSEGGEAAGAFRNKYRKEDAVYAGYICMFGFLPFHYLFVLRQRCVS
jgi:hypothetical protein